MNSQILLEPVQKRIPFGKYKNGLLYDLPVFYLEFFANKGWPPGRLGK